MPPTQLSALDQLKAELKDEINFDLSTRVNKDPESFVDQVITLLVARGFLGSLTAKGLSECQEPKYTVNGHALVNRVSGEEIPEDEPVFILRARDHYARRVLNSYLALLSVGEHRRAVQVRCDDFQNFALLHPERMKEPDTSFDTNKGD